jgi:thioesterase domain-containing protein
LAVLAGWAWASRYLAAHELAADAVIQESSMRFLAPVHGELRASVEVPGAAEIDKFSRMLVRAGRGRIRLRVDLHHQEILAAVFDGLFAAAARR